MGRPSVERQRSVLERNKFFATTNISGFGLIQSSNSSFETSVWYLVIFFFSVLTVVNIVSITNEYKYQMPIATVYVESWDGDLGDIFIHTPIVIPAVYDEFYHKGFYQFYRFPYEYSSTLSSDLDQAIAQLDSRDKLVGENATWPYVLWPLVARITAVMHHLEVEQHQPPYVHLPSTIEFIERLIDHCHKLNVTTIEAINKWFSLVVEKNFYILSSDPHPHRLKSTDFQLLTLTSSTADSANGYFMGFRLKKKNNSVSTFNYLNLDYTPMVKLLYETGVYGNNSGYSEAAEWYKTKLDKYSLFLYKDYSHFKGEAQDQGKKGGNDLLRIEFGQKSLRELKSVYNYRSIDNICNKTTPKWRCYTECMARFISDRSHCQPLFSRVSNDNFTSCSLEDYRQYIGFVTVNSNDTACINTEMQCAYNHFDACKARETFNLDESLAIVNKSETVTGRKCQKWSSQVPHRHYWASLGDNNNCQNPDNAAGPWCYTVDPSVRTELCYPSCHINQSCINIQHQCAKNHNAECKMSETAHLGENMTLTDKSVTITGRTCQRWSSQYPHSHNYGFVGDHNYCRNPQRLSLNNEAGPWCYTDDSSTRWELCYPTCVTGDEANQNLHEEVYCTDICHESCSNTVLSFDRVIESGSADEEISLQLNFVRASEKHPVFEEIYPQSWAEFLANIGGSFDIWIGASLISVVHICVYVTKQIIYAFQQKTKTGTNVRNMLRKEVVMSAVTRGLSDQSDRETAFHFNQNVAEEEDLISAQQMEYITNCIEERLRREMDYRLSNFEKTFIEQQRLRNNF